MAKIVEYIETTELRGEGTVDDPVRKVDQLWTKDGVLIAENDPCGGNRFDLTGVERVSKPRRETSA